MAIKLGTIALVGAGSYLLYRHFVEKRRKGAEEGVREVFRRLAPPEPAPAPAAPAPERPLIPGAGPPARLMPLVYGMGQVNAHKFTTGTKMRIESEKRIYSPETTRMKTDHYYNFIFDVKEAGTDVNPQAVMTSIFTKLRNYKVVGKYIEINLRPVEPYVYVEAQYIGPNPLAGPLVWAIAIAIIAGAGLGFAIGISLVQRQFNEFVPKMARALGPTGTAILLLAAVAAAVVILPKAHAHSRTTRAAAPHERRVLRWQSWK